MKLPEGKDELKDRIRLVYNLNQRIAQLEKRRDKLIKESKMSFSNFNRQYCKYEKEL
jgi:hypothetical protein